MKNDTYLKEQNRCYAYACGMYAQDNDGLLL